MTAEWLRNGYVIIGNWHGFRCNWQGLKPETIFMLATIPTQGSWWMKFHPNVTAFDIILAAVIAFGFWRGRRNGMTKEIIPLSQSLVMIIACTLGYGILGQFLAHSGVIHSVFGTFIKENTAAAVTAYLLIALVVYMAFSPLKVRFRERVDGGNSFGNSEYYLGMMSGVVRYTCLAVFCLALLNAPVYSQFDIQNRQEFNKHWFGGGLDGYNGDFIPSMDEIQSAVFKDSMLGPEIKNNLSMLLINSDRSAIQKSTAQKKPVIHMGN